MNRIALVATAFALGCAGDDPVDDAMVTGDLATSDASAKVAGRTAYGFHLDGRGMWYVSTGADLSCDQVLEFLNHAGSDSAYDPQDVLYGGYCNLTLVSDYEGEETVLENDDGLVAFWSLYCPMGEGEFVLETRHGHRDYYWSNSVWNGGPEQWTTTISGAGEGEGYTIDVDMTDFSGNYNDVIGEEPATGSISGTIDAVWCPELYQAAAFPS